MQVSDAQATGKLDPDLSEWKPHRCKQTVWPQYVSYDDTDPSEQLSTPGEDDPSHDEAGWGDVGGGGDRGNTREEKRAQLDKTRPREGVCDVRIREELETAILRAPPPRPATALPKGWARPAGTAGMDSRHASSPPPPDSLWDRSRRIWDRRS